MRKLNSWPALVGKYYNEIVRTTSLRGPIAFQEAIKKAKKVYVKTSEATKSETARQAKREWLRNNAIKKRSKKERLIVKPKKETKNKLNSFQDLT